MKQRKALILIVVLSLILAGYNSFAQTAEELLPKAIQLEEVKGELNEAIKIYQHIIDQHPGNRKVVAEAYFHLGMCFEKLGRQDAMKAYRELIKNYDDQKNIVARARDRLARLEQELAELNKEPEFRKIEIASKPQNGALSPDGKHLAFTSNNSVWLVPLHSNVGENIAGEPVRLTEVQGASNFNNEMSWSADGQYIAVNSWQNDEDFVYIIPVKGGAQRKIKMPSREGGYYPYRLSLSPDGEELVFSGLEPGVIPETRKFDVLNINVIPAEGGEPRKVSPGPGNLPSFSPDGNFIAYINNYEKKNPPEDVKQTRIDSELWIVNPSGDSPVRLTIADGNLRGPIWSPDGKYIAALSRTELGGKEITIYELSPDATSAHEVKVITLPGYGMGILAGWTPSDEIGVFILSESKSAIYTVSSAGGRSTQVTPYGAVAYSRWSPDGENITMEWGNENLDPPVQIAHVPASGGNISKVPWPEIPLMSAWPRGGYNLSPDGQKIVISAVEEPYGTENLLDLWVIPLVNGLPPVRLTNNESYEMYPCWSPDGKWMAFVDWNKSSDVNSFDAIYIISSDGGEPLQVTSANDTIGKGSIAFTPDGKRIAFFSGNAIRTIPVEGGKSEILLSGVNFDHKSRLAWSSDGSRIAYNHNGKVWLTDLSTGEKTDLKTGLPENYYVEDFDWSPDGQKITFIASTGEGYEFFLISNFMNF